MAAAEHFEWALIRGSAVEDATEIGEIVNAFGNGEYAKLLSSARAQTILLDEQTNSPKAISEKVWKVSAVESWEIQLEVLSIGVASLYLFLQGAWTGPLINAGEDKVLELLTSKDFVTSSQEYLKANQEPIYHLTPKPGLLAVARVILVDCSHVFTQLKTKSIWAARCLFVQQRILENSAASVLEGLNNALSESNAVLESLDDSFSDVIGQFRLEYGLVQHFHHKDEKAVSNFKKAQEATKFTWELTGALGKRTKFQTFDVSQLVVVAESAKPSSSNGVNVSSAIDSKSTVASFVPSNLDLNDDTILDKIAFTAPGENESETSKVHPSNQGNLSPLDQSILLAYCLNVKNTNPVHGLTNEQMSPFVARVLENPNNWLVHSMALLLRSRLEGDKSRTIERAALQLQVLVDQISTDDAPVEQRMRNFFSLLMPSKWQLERELAERYAALGVIRSALQIFERLEMWDQAVECYQMLENEAKAEEIVRQQLEIHPDSPKLLCILGDIKKNPQYYEKAWEVSEGHYSRAMRSLGTHYFRKNEHEKALEAYEKGLAINPLFPTSWFVMGCSAIQLSDWEKAVVAFSRCVNIEGDNSEAWANLASVNIKLGKKREAWHALREALRLNYDNYRMWQNYLYTSIDIGEFSEAILAMQRILELRWDKDSEKENVVDVEILRILMQESLKGRGDGGADQSSRLANRVSEYIDNALDKLASFAPLADAAGDFHKALGNYPRALDLYQKSYRAYLNRPALTADLKVFEEAVDATIKLADAFAELGSAEETKADGTKSLLQSDWQYQAKQALKSISRRCKKYFEGTAQFDRLEAKITEIEQKQ
ncbi:hypothetical protein BJ742DRAFT_789084 [Cladochytrium replicatum]|nr:hypothetical protein BJ742DRAFT_789084 [Cladochytrium replicatum]